MQLSQRFPGTKKKKIIDGSIRFSLYLTLHCSLSTKVDQQTVVEWKNKIKKKTSIKDETHEKIFYTSRMRRDTLEIVNESRLNFTIPFQRRGFVFFACF